MGNMEKHRSDKQKLRKLMEANRQQLSEEQRRSSSESISRFALELIVPLVRSSARPTLFTFMPFRSEVDVTPLTRWWWEAGYHVVVPKVDKALQTMEAFEISSFEELEPGAWGIPEPRSMAPRLATLAAIDVMIIPGLAYDRQGGRLGYGSGFYDRFLDRYDVRGLPHPYKLGVCFETQLQDELPMEQHDLRVDRIITEEGVYDILSPKSS
ncbi:MAG: 5-formyltetrahydrofolate cyclo-ligase [Paenibacillaceae bacterium]